MFADRYVGGGYLENAPDWHTEEAPWKAGKVFDLLERNSIKPRSVVDVGCGAGEVLSQLSRRLGSQAACVGYDISPAALQLAEPKAHPSLEFRNEDFLRVGAEKVDLLLLLDVLEHVPDYLAFLRQLNGRARQFVFHVPLDTSLSTVVRGSQHELQMRQDYGHLHYFTRETALATLSDTGYRAVDTVYTWDHETDSLGLEQSLRRPLRAAARLCDGWLYRSRPAWAARLRPHFNLLVLAEPFAVS